MQDIILPEVGENIESGTVVSVLVKVGDQIAKGADLIELETDKASLPVPAPVGGVIKEILVSPGEDVKIGAVIMRIEAGTESAPAGQPAPAAPAQTSAVQSAPAPAAKPASVAPQPAAAA